jgi:divinyl protochlorophyllide a 8-vinyl-reductase
MPEHRHRDRQRKGAFPAGAVSAGGKASGVIGPNAALQLAEAMTALRGEAETARLFGTAGLSCWLSAPPGDMVPVSDVERLYAVLYRDWPAAAAALCADAGRRTADYVIANRIPAVARSVLQMLPAGLAAPLLARAVVRNAWTFAGEGALQVLPGRPMKFLLQGQALALAGCPWHRAVFQRLFRVLVSPSAAIAHARYAGPDGPGDVLIVRW